MTMTSSHSQTRCLTSRAYRYLSPALRQLRSRPARRPVLPRLSAVRRQRHLHAVRQQRHLHAVRRQRHLHAVRGWRPPHSPPSVSAEVPSAGLKRIDSSMHRLLARRTSQRIQPIRPNAAHPDLRRGDPRPLQHTRCNCGEAWTSHLDATLLRLPPLLRSLPPRGRPVPVPQRRRGRGPWRAPRLLQGVS